MKLVPHLLFRFFDPEWYESLDYHQPSDELLSIARSIISPTWGSKRNGKWFYLSPPGNKLPQQGWKIHISATVVNCEEVLRIVARVCQQRETAFKFTLDRFFVALMTTKIWSRESSGKFITVYPLDVQHFYELLEALSTELQGIVGPYILSDRRYKDSHVVYYRYGGITSLKNLTILGEQQYMIVAPDGSLIPDRRVPYWDAPAWVTDSLHTPDPADEQSEPVLKDGRYLIEQVLSFSVNGGVYRAIDHTTGASVVIKEARPATGVNRQNQDAVDRLRKEYRLLQKLQNTGITPTPIDLFEDWEHLFLVEEYIPGPDLGIFTASSSPFLKLSPTDQEKQDYIIMLSKAWSTLAQSLVTLHEAGIIYGDLSVKNVLVKNGEQGNGDVSIIDLEAAYEQGVDAPVALNTPGFMNPARKGTVNNEQDDVYALGAVMLGSLFPINSILDIEPSAKQVFVTALGNDLGLSERLQHLIQQCMNNDPAKRPAPRQIVEIIKASSLDARTIPTEEVPSQTMLLTTTRGITDYIRASADARRTDRLFPADPMVFITNPLNVAYGATGTAYALHKIDGTLPKNIRGWLLARPTHPAEYPPGLYIGSAGIAWALWEMGMEEVALQTLRSAENHPLLWDMANIFYGAAGYGLSCLHFYLATKDQHWLDQAIQVGEWLLYTKQTDERGYSWPDTDGEIRLGYAKGASGIALYLLYLSVVSGEQHFLEVGKRALNFDLSHLYTTEENYLSVPRGSVGSFENVITQYWINGSAGIATALVRFWAYTKDATYLKILESLAPDTFRKYTAFTGLFQGLAGLGNFLLDAYQFTGQDYYLRQAQRTASGVLLYQIQRPAGIAFPGEQLFRISTDFGTGSAGVALFLYRLAHADQPIGSFNFTLDHFLQAHTANGEQKVGNKEVLVRV